jgi:hypothetical protein
MRGLLDLIDTPPAPAATRDSRALVDAAQESRRLAMLEMLRRHPEVARAAEVDADVDPVRVALAVWGLGSCELLMPRDRCDPFRFLALLEQHGGMA